MAQNPNIKFESPQTIIQSSSRVAVDGGVVDVTVRGPTDQVVKYLGSATIEVQIASVSRLDQGERPRLTTPETIRKHEGRTLIVQIQPAQTKEALFTLQVNVDPAEVLDGYAHWYEVSGVNLVAVECQSVSGDADIDLFEMNWNGQWLLRDSSSTTNQFDTIKGRRQLFSGYWGLAVHGKNDSACSYNLSGVFINDEYYEYTR